MILYDYIDDNLLDESEEEKPEQDSSVSEDSTEELEAVEENQEISSADEKVEDSKETQEVASADEKVEDSEETQEVASTDEKVEDSDETQEVASTDDKSEEEINKEVNFPHLIGKKVGMTQLFLDDGNSLPATILEVGPCSITQIKTESNEGYSSIQLAFEDLKESKANKSQLGHFSKSKILPKKYLKEFRCKENNDFKLGDVITLKQFDLGDFVKVTGTSKGKGFTGHMKRHGFGGGRRSHGKNSVMRKSGSVGAGSDPSRVFPGMKMAGRKGNYTKTIKNLSVIKLDYDNNLIFVTGSVPGANNGLVYLSKI